MLYQKNKDGLFRYFLRQTNNDAIAEELAQDVWTNVIQSASRYKPKAKFTTFLYHIAHNRFIDHIRRQTIRPLDSSHSSSETNDLVDTDREQPEQHLENEQLATALKQLIFALPAEQREAFLLKEEAGLSQNDIAYVTGCNNETVKSRLRYAYNKLRNGLGERV